MVEKLVYNFRKVRFIFYTFLYKKILGIKAGNSFYLRKNPLVLGAKFIVIGKGCKIGDFLWLHAIEHYNGVLYKPCITIGDNFHANNNLHIGAVGLISIGDNVLVGSNVLITDHSHGIYSNHSSCSSPTTPPFDRELKPGNIIIGNEVWIGDGAKLIGSISIGSGVVIGANAVITKSIPDKCIVVGYNRVVKIWDDIKQEWICA